MDARRQRCGGLHIGTISLKPPFRFRPTFAVEQPGGSAPLAVIAETIATAPKQPFGTNRANGSDGWGAVRLLRSDDG